MGLSLNRCRMWGKNERDQFPCTRHHSGKKVNEGKLHELSIKMAVINAELLQSALQVALLLHPSSTHGSCLLALLQQFPATKEQMNGDYLHNSDTPGMSWTVGCGQSVHGVHNKWIDRNKTNTSLRLFLVSPQVTPGLIQADRVALWDSAGLCSLWPGALQGHEPLWERSHVLPDVAHD